MKLNDKLPRLYGWSIIATALVILIAIIAPQNIPVLVYKLACLTLAAAIAYRVDRSLFPYARPHIFKEGMGGLSHNFTDYPNEKNVGPVELYRSFNIAFCASMIRRALIVLAFVIGIGMIL